MAKKIDKETKSLNELIGYFEDFSLRHNQLNDFGYGDVTQLENADYLEYPAMWVFLDDTQLINNGRNGFNEVRLNFQILVMDEVDQKENMIQEVQSDALTIANDLTAEFTYNRFYQDQFIKISDNATITPFRENFKSRLAGQRIELPIDIPFTNCYALDPIDDIPGYSARTITARAQTIQQSICSIVEDCSLEFSKNITFEQDVNVLGSVSATTFYGDGSNLTGLKATFSGLTDTNLSGVTDGQIAIYDSSNNEWIPGNVETTFSGLTDTSFTGLTNGDVAVYESANNVWKNKNQKQGINYIDVYDTDMKGTGIPGSGIDVSFDTVRYIDSDWFSHNDPSVTIDKDGTYKINYQINTRAGGRATSSAELYLDTGSGYFKVGGSTVYMYNRTSNNGWNTGTGEVVLNLSAGDKVKVRAFQNSGSGSEMENESSLVIQNTLDGITGPPGKQGKTGSLNGTVFTGGFQMEDTVITGASGTIITDLSKSNVFNITLSGDITLDYNNLTEGGTFQWIINQDSSGGHTLNYATGKFSAPGGNKPDIAQTANAKTLISGIYDDVDRTMIVFNAKEIQGI